MKQIHRYHIPAEGREIDLPQIARAVSMVIERGEAYIYVEERPSVSSMRRHFRIHETDHQIPETAGYIATAHDGKRALHLYEHRVTPV